MREIKFRVWYAGIMWQPEQIPCIEFGANGIRKIRLNQEPGDYSLTADTWTSDNDFEIMRYTGLKDYNNRRVCEADIVRDIRTDGIDIIEWNGRSFVMKYYDEGDNIFNFPNYWEVIGNIYNNPELVEEGNG